MSILDDLDTTKETAARARYCLERCEEMMLKAFTELDKLTNIDDCEIMEEISQWLELPLKERSH